METRANKQSDPATPPYDANFLNIRAFGASFALHHQRNVDIFRAFGEVAELVEGAPLLRVYTR